MSLETSKVMHALHHKMMIRVAELQEWLGTGNAKDFSDYHAVCGKIHGLLEACQAINEFNNDIEQDDE